jgi:hypothetical protein
MKRKYLYSMTILLLFFCVVMNLSIDEKNARTNFSLGSLTLVAKASDNESNVQACVTVTYYGNNMKQCQSGSICWNSSGTECGRQSCCESTSANSSCNEYECSN